VGSDRVGATGSSVQCPRARALRFWLQAIAQTKKQLTPFEVNCLLSLRITHTNKVAHSKGFEPLTPKFVAWCSIQLSYECVFFGRRALSCKDEPKST
jgi:hypothetical protein